MAVSVDSPEDSREMLAELKEDGTPLDFPIASDTGREIIKAYGVYDHDNDLALPATLLLNKKGEIAWKYIGGSIFDRPEEDALIAQLNNLKEEE